jgi:hypothetical protein
MKRLIALGAGMMVSTSAVSTSQSEFRFSGEIQANQLMSTAFIQPVAAGYVRFLELEPGLRLELATPREDGDKAVTLVRLLLQDHGDYRILHEAHITGSSQIERSFTYRVCGSEVTFFAPAPTKTPQCNRN